MTSFRFRRNTLSVFYKRKIHNIIYVNTSWYAIFTSNRLFSASPLMSFNFALRIRHAAAHSLRFVLLIIFDKISFSKYTYACEIVRKSTLASNLLIRRISRFILKREILIRWNLTCKIRLPSQFTQC